MENQTEDSAEAGAAMQYKVALHQMSSDEGVEWDLVVDQPEGINPAFSRALSKRASM